MNYQARLVFDWLLILATLIAADLLGPWAWWPAALVIGSRQHAIGETGHMAMHGGRKWLCRLAFLPLGISPEKYQRFHLAHHRHLGVRGRDPEIAVYAKWPERWAKPRRRDLALDALGLHAPEAIITINQITTPLAMAPQAVLVSLLALVWPIALLWPAAVITGFMLCHRLRARTEHPFNAKGTTIRQKPPTRWEWLMQQARGNRDWDHWAHHNPGRAR